MVPSNRHNLLVISDLHLGEHLRPHGPVQCTMVERQLTTFIRHHAHNREGGRPWRLVINGDMVDFLAVVVFPEMHGLRPDYRESIFFGLGCGEAASMHKLELVLSHHQRLFVALAEFLGAGHELFIVAGNHDVEFQWPAVQERFRDELGSLWSRVRTAGSPAEAEVRTAIQFHEWFYYEPGVLWLEHGHQYDGYCSFEHVLSPTDAEDSDWVELNLGSVAMRYMTNLLPGHHEGDNDLSLGQYLAKAALDRRHLWTYVRGYARMVCTLAGQWLRRRTRAVAFQRLSEDHRQRAHGHGLKRGLTPVTMDRVLSLHTAPVYSSWSRLLQSLMLPRVGATLVALCLIPLAMSLTMPWLALGCLMGLTGVCHVVLGAAREEVDPTPSMVRAATSLQRLTDTPLVVFGHSHRAMAQQLLTGGWYVNSGTWVGDGSQAMDFSHLRLLRESDAVQVSLCRWNGCQAHEVRCERVRVRVPQNEVDESIAS